MDGIVPLLIWIDGDPARQHTLTWLAYLVTCALALLPARGGGRAGGWSHPLLFALAVIATLCICRWPVWFDPNELNPDESQMLAGAITLREYPVYWKHVDGTTHGPLTDYFLLLLSWLGLPLNFVTARAAATVLQAASLLGVWGAMRHVAPETVARVGILPGVAFWSFTHWTDHVYYSSELVPIALVATALWLLVSALARPDWTMPGTAWRSAWGGLALGTVPFAKLQLAPVGLALGVFALGVWGWQHARPGARRAALSCAAGALAAPLGVAVFLMVYGLIPQFWTAYILSSLGYVESKPTGFTDMVADFFGLMSQGHFFVWFGVPAIGYALWQGRLALDHATGFARSLLWFGWFFAAVAFISIILPGRLLSHYMQIAVVPVALVASLHLAASVRHRPQTARAVRGALAGFLLVTVASQLWRHATGYNIHLGRYQTNRVVPPKPESRFLLQHAAPGDRLAMWGWHSQVYVETGLPQGTREAHTAFQQFAGPLRDFYRDRYLRDFTRGRPAWFVDAVRPQGFGFTDRSRDGHESFPALARYVADNYVLAAEIDGCRIYRLQAR